MTIRTNRTDGRKAAARRMDAICRHDYASVKKGAFIMKKSIIITGAGRGIGAATKTFLDAGIGSGLSGGTRHAGRHRQRSP